MDKKFRVSWNETHSIVVEAGTTKEAIEKVEEMRLAELKAAATYEVSVGKAMAVMS